MKKTAAFSLVSGAAGVAMLAAMVVPAFAAGNANHGFNEYGYNYGARVFVGPADGVDKKLDGKVWGDPTYANDHLVMKWNAQWDDCNANGYDDPQYCAGAWVDNEWNGNVPGGSGTTEHDKIIWVGSGGDQSPYWRPGGELIWNNYEVISQQGTDATGHYSLVHAVPNGYGGK